ETRRAAFIFNPGNPGSAIQLESARSAAGKLGVDVIDARASDLAAIETAMTMIGRQPGGAVILPPDPFTAALRRPVIDLAARNALPVVSGLRSFADEGGLLAYGVYIPDLFRQAAGYVDRILRGEQPADLPVMQPTRLQPVINQKTAKALGLAVPAALLVAADDVIE